MNQAPLSPLLITPVARNQAKQRAAQLIQEIARDLVKPTEASGDSIAQRETVSKITKAAQATRQLSYQGIQQLAAKFQVAQQQQHQGQQQP